MTWIYNRKFKITLKYLPKLRLNNKKLCFDSTGGQKWVKTKFFDTKQAISVFGCIKLGYIQKSEHFLALFPRKWRMTAIGVDTGYKGPLIFNGGPLGRKA